MEPIFIIATGVFLGGLMTAAALWAFGKSTRIYEPELPTWPQIWAWLVPMGVVLFTFLTYGS